MHALVRNTSYIVLLIYFAPAIADKSASKGVSAVLCNVLSTHIARGGHSMHNTYGCDRGSRFCDCLKFGCDLTM